MCKINTYYINVLHRMIINHVSQSSKSMLVCVFYTFEIFNFCLMPQKLSSDPKIQINKNCKVSKSHKFLQYN